MTTQTITATRRGFLKATGALSFAFLSAGGVAVFSRSTEAQEAASGRINAWVTITPDDQMTIMFGAAEMGQGVNTSLPMIVAEEMDADWNTVSVEQVNSDPDGVYGNPGFGGNLFAAGSSSLEGYYNYLRQSGAQARQILIQTAARHWGVAAEGVSTRKGEVVHESSGQTMRYGEVAALPEPVTSIGEIAEDDLKPRSAWTIVGTDVERLDIPDKTIGATKYSIDVVVPDMLYAVQLLAPVEGETPSVNSDAAARAVPGVVDIIPMERAVAVLAENFTAAVAGRDALDVSWSRSSPFRSANSSEELAALARAADDMDGDAVVWEARGDADVDFDRGNVITSHYTTEHVYHAQMEPLNAVASVDEDGRGAEVWLGTQSQTVSIGVAAGVLGTTPDRIRFHAMQMGGAFGRRTVFAGVLLRDALLLSKAAGRPVKLVWTREDDVKNGWLRPATVQRLDAVLDDRGNLAALRHRIAAPSIFEFAMPNRWNPETRRDLLVMEGSESTDYDIPVLRAEHVLVPRQSRLSAWRGIGWAPNCYARECFLDELAAAAGSAPVAFRRGLLAKSPRALAVLDAAVEMSDFGNAPEGRAHGLAFAGYKATLATGVAEVSYEENRLRVHKFWAAVDPGIVIHPQAYRAQVEGGILFGMSSVLRERSTFMGGQIDQNNFYDYEPIRINEIPEIEVRLVESGNPPSGGGEIGVPMTAPAIANAIRGLTGAAPHHLPFPPHGA